jgi:hypothetical protein
MNTSIQRLPLLLGLSLCACCVAAPSPEDLLATGFRSPSQAFGTFQTALAGDHLDFNYRCFSDSFKARTGADDASFKVGLNILLAENAGMKYISEAEILSERLLDPTTAELIVELNKFFVTVRARVILKREDFFEAWSGNEIYFDGFRSFGESTSIYDDSPNDLFGHIDVPEEKDATQITEIRIGQDWHIDSFEVLDEDPVPLN